MKVQVIDGKIIAIGENIIKTKDNNVYEVDITTLPLTEEGEIDYEKIFNSPYKIEDGKLILILEL